MVLEKTLSLAQFFPFISFPVALVSPWIANFLKEFIRCSREERGGKRREGIEEEGRGGGKRRREEEEGRGEREEEEGRGGGEDEGKRLRSATCVASPDIVSRVRSLMGRLLRQRRAPPRGSSARRKIKCRKSVPLPLRGSLVRSSTVAAGERRTGAVRISSGSRVQCEIAQAGSKRPHRARARPGASDDSFKTFGDPGDHQGYREEMNGKNWGQRLYDCKIIDGKNVTGTDVDNVFTKSETSRVITYEEFKSPGGAAPKSLRAEQRGGPNWRRRPHTRASHKERFDESGKGRGKGGREELVENTGYVGSYKNAGTYEEKNQGQ
ncbi:unnamed protein product, partial [Coregonus sp. 'balchen']